MSSTGFYRAFEERHRGTRADIRLKLEVYLPFIAPLRQHYAPAPAVDLGCGRGEWLELLQSQGFAAQGVDLDDGMLQACRERGLPAVRGEALAYLQSLPDESQCVVSGFHLAEHIPFDALEQLVAQALRVLKPGGLLILETPNPENIVVGTTAFYLDPTHLRPIPPMLLSFIPEHLGYARVRTLRLNAPAALLTRPDIHLMDVLGGVSPDYAVVAQKAGAPGLLQAFDPAFSAPHGITLDELAQAFDQTNERGRAALHQAHAAQLGAASRRAEALERETGALKRQLQALSASHHQIAVWVDQRIRLDQDLAAERDAMVRSLSWRITAPLRWSAGGLLRGAAAARPVVSSAQARLGKASKTIVARSISLVLRQPALTRRLNEALLRYPAVWGRLRAVAREHGVIPGEARVDPSAVAAPIEWEALTERGQKIHAGLKAAIERADADRH